MAAQTTPTREEVMREVAAKLGPAYRLEGETLVHRRKGVIGGVGEVVIETQLGLYERGSRPAIIPDPYSLNQLDHASRLYATLKEAGSDPVVVSISEKEIRAIETTTRRISALARLATVQQPRVQR